MIGYSDADKCAAYLAGNGRAATAEAVKQRQFMLQCLGQIGVMLDVFTQHGEGLLNDEQFNGVCATYRVWLREPGFRQLLLNFRTGVNTGQPKFTAFVEGLMTDAPPQTET